MLSAVGTRGGGPLAGGIDRNITTNITRAFECHTGGERHGTLLISLASAGVIANLSLAGLVIARRSLRRWSSGLLLHGTIVDGSRAALLIPLGMSVLRCQPITRCSFLDTAFLLLATVTSLNLLTASLSDAPLLPPPVLVPSLLQSAGYSRSESHFASPLYQKQEHQNYHSEYYDDDANLLAETTAMPDSPQCLIFGVFMVWFAALTINLGPTFLSGALAAQAESTPTAPSCPLVRGPARHIVLNALWAAVNLLCVALASAHLRKLKKDLARARMGLLAASGVGLAGMAGILPGNKQISSSLSQTAALGSKMATVATCGGGQTNTITSHLPRQPGSLATAGELDVLIRQVQKNGRCHVRTLSTLAVINLVCWVPLYVVALVAPADPHVKIESTSPGFFGMDGWIYEFTLLAAFAHSILHPLSLLLLHHPLREGLKHCLIEWCCFICIWMGVDFGIPGGSPGNERGSSRRRGDHPLHQHPHELNGDNHNTHSFPRPQSRSSTHPEQALLHQLHHSVGDLVHIPGSSSLKMKRSTSLKSDRLLTGCGNGEPSSPTILILTDDMLPPPPLPPVNSAFRKQVSVDDLSPTSEDNRW